MDLLLPKFGEGKQKHLRGKTKVLRGNAKQLRGNTKLFINNIFQSCPLRASIAFCKVEV